MGGNDSNRPYFSSKIKNIIIIARTKTSAIYILIYIYYKSTHVPYCSPEHDAQLPSRLITTSTVTMHILISWKHWHFSSKCKQLSFMTILIKLSCTIINFTNYFYTQVQVFILCRRIYHLHTVNNLKPWNMYRISIF